MSFKNAGLKASVLFAFAISLFLGLALLAYIDAHTFRLPNEISFALIGIGLLWAYVSGDLRAGLIGGAAGYLFLIAVEISYRALRGQDGIGRGDAKLLAVGGAWCGWMGLPFIILIASGCGLIAALFPAVRNQASSGRLPFGPFLSFAIIIVWVSGQLAAV